MRLNNSNATFCSLAKKYKPNTANVNFKHFVKLNVENNASGGDFSAILSAGCIFIPVGVCHVLFWVLVHGYVSCLLF